MTVQGIDLGIHGKLWYSLIEVQNLKRGISVLFNKDLERRLCRNILLWGQRKLERRLCRRIHHQLGFILEQILAQSNDALKKNTSNI